MAEWWSALTGLNQFFYGAAAFFSVLFLFQLISALIGLGEHETEIDDSIEDIDHDVTYHEFESGAHADAVETAVSFKILSIRSIITFLTLFTWGGALYLNNSYAVSKAMAYSIVWGLVGMFCIALVFHMMRRLTETGTSNLNTAIGSLGTVYLDIPEGGSGEVRVTVSGAVSYVRARTADGKGLKSGTPVRIVKRLGQTMLEVKPVEKE
jgi:membrane protein implicated in regulation of membrane protease activity